jgi:putative ABC transport system substrate-binding protein
VEFSHQGNITMNTRVFSKSVLVVLCTFLTYGLNACQVTEPEKITVGVVNFVVALQPVFEGFKQGMAELGYSEGENIIYIYREATNQNELNPIANEFVASKVDLILSISTPATIAAKEATGETRIPVVFAPVTDPVSAGLAESLSNPGGNLTGITNLGSESRRLEWLLKLAPETKEIYIPYNPKDPSAAAALVTARSAALELGVDLVTREASDDEQMTAAINEMPVDADAVFMLPEGLAINHIQEFVNTTINRQLPLSGPTTTQVEAGALVSYGLDLFSAGEQAARLADQIIRGIDPAVLPIEEAEFNLAINLNTAEAIGLKIDPDILNQADEIFRSNTIP